MAAPMVLGFTVSVQSNLQLNAERLRHTEYAYYFMVTYVRIPPYNLKHKRKTSVEVGHTQIRDDPPLRATINLPRPESKDNSVYVFRFACQ